MNAVRRWWLRRRLRRAATFLERQMLAPQQYAALAIRVGYKLSGVPLAPGDKVDHFDFGPRIMDHLADDPTSAASQRASFQRYGPYLEAVYKLQVLDQGPRDWVEWTGWTEEQYRWARRRMNPVFRAALRFEKWYKEQTQLFPVLTGWVEKLIIAIVSFVAGLLTGRAWP